MKAQDLITGLTGIVVCIADWLNGCRRVTIQPQELKDGKPLDMFTFDAEQFVYVDFGMAGADIRAHGGPSIAPTRNADPR